MKLYDVQKDLSPHYLLMIKQDILLTVDSIVFTIYKEKLSVLLIQRLIEPFKDMRAIPWGFVLDNETLEQAAYRELEEETKVKNTYLEQLYTFSDVDRDPRGRVISCAYMALMRHEDINAKAESDAKEVKVFSMDKLPKLWFDHKKILDYALQRLRYKLEYTNVVQYLLPKHFTLSELQQVYEIVLNEELDVRNFRKKIDKLGIVKETWERVVRGAHRPAMLYEFTTKKTVIVDVL